jgi:UDP-N-acetylglucosamine 2-epimerase
MRFIAAVAAVVFIAALFGCGSDSGSVSKEAFLKEAKMACHDGEREREEAISAAMLRYQEGEAKATKKLQEEAVLKVIEPYQRTTETLADLEAPEGSEEELEAVVQAREEAVEKTKADPATALKGDEAFQKPVKLSEELGLGDCDA